jgi:hypothetical protein
VPTVLTTGDEIRCGAIKLLITLPEAANDTEASEEEGRNE